MTPRARGFYFGVSWIVDTDEACVAGIEIEAASTLASVRLLAGMFRKEPEEVAAIVVTWRARRVELNASAARRRSKAAR